MLSGLHFFTIFQFSPNRPQWTRSEPVHHITLAYQVKGSADHYYNGQILSFKKDYLAFINTDDCYRVKVLSPGPCIAIHFTVDTPIDLHFSIFDCSSDPQVKREFLNCLSAWNRHDEISEFEYLASFYKIWAYMLRIVREQKSSASPCDRSLATAHNYLLEHFQNPQTSIAQAAQAAGISERWLCTRFQEVYHVTPMKHLTSLRINAALEMLNIKNYTVSEIASSVGFSSATYFIRVFRKEIGISPGAYRKRLRS